MRIRTLPAALALAFLVPVTACGPREAGDQAGEDTAAARDTAPQVLEEPDYGVQTMACDAVAAYLQDTAATEQPVEIEGEGDRLYTSPDPVVVRLGGQLRWTSESLKWVVEFKEASPLASGARRVRGTATRGVFPEGDAGTVTSDSTRCGRYYYVVAGYAPDSPDTVYVSDPPIWVTR